MEQNQKPKNARTKQAPNRQVRQPYAPPTTGFIFTLDSAGNPITIEGNIPQGNSSNAPAARSLSDEFHSKLLVNEETPAHAFKFDFNEQNRAEPSNRPHFTFTSDLPKEQLSTANSIKKAFGSVFGEAPSTTKSSTSFKLTEQPNEPTNTHQILSQFTSIEISEILQQSVVKEQMKLAQNIENLRQEQEAIAAQRDSEIALLKEDLEFEKGFLEMEEQRFREAEQELLKEIELNKINFAALKVQMDSDNEANKIIIEKLESRLINNQLLEDLPINAPSSIAKQRAKAQQDVNLFNDSVRDVCCPICTHTFKEYASDCGHMYCLACITACKNDAGRNGKCYFCNATIGVIRKIFMN